jgi:hypothetical protein
LASICVSVAWAELITRGGLLDVANGYNPAEAEAFIACGNGASSVNRDAEAGAMCQAGKRPGSEHVSMHRAQWALRSAFRDAPLHDIHRTTADTCQKFQKSDRAPETNSISHV